MKRIDCSKNCPKTKMLKASKYCQGYAEFDGKDIVYSCDINLKDKEEKLLNFYNCNSFNYDIKEACYSCPLSCKKNKSRIKKIKDYKVLEAERILESYRGMISINDFIIDNAKNELKKEITKESKDIIDKVSIANKILNSAFKGNKVSLPHLYKFIKSMKYEEK